jgi:uncharacterized protein
VITVEEARRLYRGADSAHDFDHVLRVLRLAERIGEEEGADLSVVRAAALLHDVGRASSTREDADHAEVGSRLAREVLAGAPAASVEAVAEAIAAHRFRRGPEPVTIEARVLFDADKLDAIGAIGVARAYAHGGAQGQRLWASLEGMRAEGAPDTGDNPQRHTPVHEFAFKLSRLRERLYTDSGRRIAAERHDFMVAYFEVLDAEVRGDR